MPASGDGYRQKARPGLKPRLSVRKIQNLVKASYRLRRVNLGGGPRPTYTEAWLLHGNCLVGTAKHISAIIDNNLCDTFDNRAYDGRLYGGTASDERQGPIHLAPRAAGRQNRHYPRIRSRPANSSARVLTLLPAPRLHAQFRRFTQLTVSRDQPAPR